MAKDLKDSPDWVVIADDWVDIDDKMDDDDDDDSVLAESKNELHDHVTPPVVPEKENNTSGPKAESKNTSVPKEENENTSGPKVLTRYVDVPEGMVKFFAGKDVVMDLQMVSGAIIQITNAYDVEAKNRPVRLIGNLENVEKAEKLIEAVLALADAGGSVLLRKHDYDTTTGDYCSKYGHHQKQEPRYQSHNYLLRSPESSWGPFQFDRKRIHNRIHGRR